MERLCLIEGFGGVAVFAQRARDQDRTQRVGMIIKGIDDAEKVYLLSLSEARVFADDLERAADRIEAREPRAGRYGEDFTVTRTSLTDGTGSYVVKAGDLGQSSANAEEVTVLINFVEASNEQTVRSTMFISGGQTMALAGVLRAAAAVATRPTPKTT